MAAMASASSRDFYWKSAFYSALVAFPSSKALLTYPNEDYLSNKVDYKSAK